MYIEKDPIHNKTLTTIIYAFTIKMYVIILLSLNIMYIVPNQPKKCVFKYVLFVCLLCMLILLKCFVKKNNAV